MWGDLERAMELSAEDSISKLLFEISGPASIKVSSPTWQDLLISYDVLVHLDNESNSVVRTACSAMASHAESSGNLAALSIHVARMLTDLTSSREEEDMVLMGKARATSGALNLCRVLSHETISAGTELHRAYLYREEGGGVDGARQLLAALSAFLSVAEPSEALYDAQVLAFKLLLVLLSTQLYSPPSSTHLLLASSSPPQPFFTNNYFLDGFFKLAYKQHHRNEAPLLPALLTLIVTRPAPPLKSIAHHHSHLLHSLLHSQPDLCDENSITHATIPSLSQHSPPPNNPPHPSTDPKEQALILHATKGVLKASSTLLLLPFRLLFLALLFLRPTSIRNPSALTHKLHRYPQHHLWLTHSPLADLAASLFLLLTHNYRSNPPNPHFPNPFLSQLSSLQDNRYPTSDGTVLSLNFDKLYKTFSSTLHNQLGALLLYTVLRSSPNFAASVSVRLDLDHLVLPLLRTLYTQSILHPTTSYPSQSHLYVVLILLLLFSQDPSFASDAFRRIVIKTLPWYRERQLHDISLGSLIFLALFRSISFNLHRMQDAFLLNNCLAVLLNLSPFAVGLHPYAAMRLATVSTSIFKRYAQLSADKTSNVNLKEMYGEASKAFIQILKQCLRADVFAKNLDLVYAAVYQQMDFAELSSSPIQLFQSDDFRNIVSVIQFVDSLIRKDGETYTATEAMELLHANTTQLKHYISGLKPTPEDKPARSFDAVPSSRDFTFTYEEDSDPEVFFIPYIWEVVVCEVTATTIEWSKSHIKVFELLDEKGEDKFANDVLEVV